MWSHGINILRSASRKAERKTEEQPFRVCVQCVRSSSTPQASSVRVGDGDGDFGGGGGGGDTGGAGRGVGDRDPQPGRVEHPDRGGQQRQEAGLFLCLCISPLPPSVCRCKESG